MATLRLSVKQEAVPNKELSSDVAAPERFPRPVRLRIVGGVQEAAVTDPYWIVMDLSRHHDAPFQGSVRFFFRHPTEEGAQKEAQRLASANRRRRFAVFAFCGTYKMMPALSPTAT